MAPQAIPTPHNGILYRSRLEARYAVFFHELHIMHEYETQGFKTESAYLPDFVIFAATGTLWLEVKPTWDSDPDGIVRFRQFAAKRPQPSRAALVIGLPGAGGGIVVIGGDESAIIPAQGPWEDDTCEWRPCPVGIHFDLTPPGPFRTRFAEDGCDDKFGGDGEEKLERAIAKARSARFDSHRA